MRYNISILNAEQEKIYNGVWSQPSLENINLWLEDVSRDLVGEDERENIQYCIEELA